MENGLIQLEIRLLLLGLAVSSIVIIGLVYFIRLWPAYLKKKIGVDERLLKDAIQSADEYEIEYLRGGLSHLFNFAFGALAEKGYLVKNPDDSDSAFPYLIDNTKDIHLLHEIERATLLSWEKRIQSGVEYDRSCTRDPTDEEDSNRILVFTPIIGREYHEKITKLAFRNPDDPFWLGYLTMIGIIGFLFGIFCTAFAIFTAFLLRNQFITMLLGLLIILMIIEAKLFLKVPSGSEFNPNLQKYFQLFEEKQRAGNLNSSGA